MKIKNLKNIFVERCKGFSDAHGALDLETVENKKFSQCAVTLNTVKIEFVYLQRASTLIPQSTLFCRIYINKNDHIFFHLPELLVYSGIDDFRQCYFSYIENEDRMNACFDALASTIDEYLPLINKISAVDSKRFYDMQYAKLGEKFNIDDDVAMTDGDSEKAFFCCAIDYEDLCILPDFTYIDGGYHSFLSGNFGKAKKFYEKRISTGKASEYDKRLYEFICDDKNASYKGISRECFAAADAKLYLNGDKFIYLFKSFILSYLGIGAAFAALCLIIRAVISIGAEAVFGFPWYISLIFAALPAIFCVMAFGKRFSFLFKRKDLKKYLDFYDILSGGSDKIAKVAFAAVSIVSFILTAVLAFFGTAVVYDDHIRSDIDGDMIFEEIYYCDVEKIYHIDARYNIYGDRINRGSYVFEMNSGEVYDFDSITSERETENTLLPIMNHGTESIIFFDTDRDLPDNVQEKLNELK